jgi:chromate transporter
MGLKMLLPHRQRPVVLGFALLAFVSVGVLRWPMIAVLLVLAPISIAVAWVRRR